MGKRNKLLSTVAGAPMLVHVVRAAMKSRVQQVIVVTGYQAELVQGVMSDCNIQVVHNPNYMSGMASSLRAGIDAIAKDMDGVLVLLGDMPLVTTGQINELISEFDPETERDIVVPVKDRRRGNPVLWSRRWFDAMRAITGDTGARGLLEDHEANIRDVPTSDDAVFADFDTPDSLREFRNR